MSRWPALLTSEQVCEYLSISKTTLNRMKACGDLRTVRVAGRNIYRYRRNEVDLWIDKLEHEDADRPVCCD